MDISDWRVQIDQLDKKLVELINQRAAAAREIGKLKRSTGMPIYEPDRERCIQENVRAANHGPLSHAELWHVFERLIDVMRKLQQQEIVGSGAAGPETPSGNTELEAELND